MSKKQSDEEKAKKLEVGPQWLWPSTPRTQNIALGLPQQVVSLRRDLEHVRNLTELTRKREKEKLRSAQTIQSFVTNFLFPFKPVMSSVLNEIVAYVPSIRTRIHV